MLAAVGGRTPNWKFVALQDEYANWFLEGAIVPYWPRDPS